MMNTKQKKDYNAFLNIFGLKIGDVVSFESWFSYIVKEDGFHAIKFNGKVLKDPTSEAYSKFFEREYSIISKKS